jgi:hypothetical protein
VLFFIFELKYLHNLRTLIITDIFDENKTNITDEGLKYLPQLQELEATNVDITDDGNIYHL